MKPFIKPQVFFRDTDESIDNVFELEKIGAGHDGYVFKYDDKALKVLKYGIDGRKERGLMTFNKVLYFENELDLKRFVQPIDILLDEDGMYSGYVMKYYQNLVSSKKNNNISSTTIGDFTCNDLVTSVNELEMDVSQLTSKSVAIKDINRGSYIFSEDFLHICDMDKFLYPNATEVYLNWEKLNYIFAKMLYLEKKDRANLDKMQLRQMSEWVRKVSNDKKFLDKMRTEVKSDCETPISEYSDFVFQKVIR